MYGYKLEKGQIGSKLLPPSSKVPFHISAQTVLGNSSCQLIPAIKSNYTTLSMLSDLQESKVTGRMDISPIIQRIKINLNTDEKERLNFIVLGSVLDDKREDPSEDGQQLFSLEKGVGDTIGIKEDIIFLGHGKRKGIFSGARTMEGHTSEALAFYVCKILRTSFSDEEMKAWEGRVVLLGCYTKPLADDMYKIINEKIGIKADIISTLADITTISVPENLNPMGVGVKYNEEFSLTGHKLSEKDKNGFKGKRPYIIDFNNPDHIYNPNKDDEEDFVIL